MEDDILDQYMFAEDVENMQEFALQMPPTMAAKGELYYKIKRAMICDVEMDNRFCFPFPFREREECLILAGNLIHTEKGNEAAPKLKAAIVDHLVEISENEKVTVAIWVKDHAGQWFRLNRPYSSHYAAMEAEFTMLINGFVSNQNNESFVQNGRLMNEVDEKISMLDFFKISQELGGSPIAPSETKVFLEGLGSLGSDNDKLVKANIRVNVNECEVCIRKIEFGTAQVPSCPTIRRELRVRSGSDANWYCLALSDDAKSDDGAQAELSSLFNLIYSPCYMKPKKLPSNETFFTVIDFSILNANGENIGINELGSTTGSSVVMGELTGKLVPSGGQPLISIRTQVNDYYLEVELHKKQSYAAFYVKSAVDDHWYQLVNPCETYDKFPPSADELLSQYNWPSDSDDVWRRISRYKVVGKNGNMVSSSEITERSASHPFIVMGELQACPTRFTGLRPLHFRFIPMIYSIDFGMIVNDENSGLWFQTKIGNWYKALSPPADDYREIADRDQKNIDTTIRLYDALLRLDSAICDYDEAKGKYYTNWTIDQVWAAGKHFDIVHVRSIADFIFSNLEHVLDFKKSKLLKKSLLEPSNPQLLNAMASTEPANEPALVTTSSSSAASNPSKSTEESEDEPALETALNASIRKSKGGTKERKRTAAKHKIDNVTDAEEGEKEVPKKRRRSRKQDKLPVEELDVDFKNDSSTHRTQAKEVAPALSPLKAMMSKPIPKKARPVEVNTFDDIDYVSRCDSSHLLYPPQRPTQHSVWGDGSRGDSYFESNPQVQQHQQQHATPAPSSTTNSRATFWSVEPSRDQDMLLQAKVKRDEEEKAKLNAWLSKGYDEGEQNQWQPAELEQFQPHRQEFNQRDQSPLSLSRDQVNRNASNRESQSTWKSSAYDADGDRSSFNHGSHRRSDFHHDNDRRWSAGSSNNFDTNGPRSDRRWSDHSAPRSEQRNNNRGESSNAGAFWKSSNDNREDIDIRRGRSGNESGERGRAPFKRSEPGQSTYPRKEDHRSNVNSSPSSRRPSKKSSVDPDKEAAHLSIYGLNRSESEEQGSVSSQMREDRWGSNRTADTRGSETHSPMKGNGHTRFDDFHSNKPSSNATTTQQWPKPASSSPAAKQKPAGYTCAHCAMRRKLPSCPNPEHEDGNLCKDIAASRATAATAASLSAVSSTITIADEPIAVVDDDVDTSFDVLPQCSKSVVNNELADSFNETTVEATVSNVVDASDIAVASSYAQMSVDDPQQRSIGQPIIGGNLFVRSESAVALKRMCKFCKSLIKRPNCTAIRHKDGCYFEDVLHIEDMNPLQLGLCTFCRSTRKIENCPYFQHVNGRHIAADPSLSAYISSAGDSSGRVSTVGVETIATTAISHLAQELGEVQELFQANDESELENMGNDAEVAVAGKLGKRVLGEDKKERLRYERLRSVNRSTENVDQSASSKSNRSSKLVISVESARRISDEIIVPLPSLPSTPTIPPALKRSPSDRKKEVQWADVATVSGKLRTIREFDPNGFVVPEAALEEPTNQ